MSAAQPAAQPDPAPDRRVVAAAIVTSQLGVLVGKRHDGKPPWTFIAGKVEEGESFADAAVREVKEEAGLEVTPGVLIGRRKHPKTGRAMVYVAATPVGPLDVFVGDEIELVEVRWVPSLSGLRELMEQPGGGTIFEPVAEYLAPLLDT